MQPLPASAPAGQASSRGLTPPPSAAPLPTNHSRSASTLRHEAACSQLFWPSAGPRRREVCCRAAGGQQPPSLTAPGAATSLTHPDATRRRAAALERYSPFTPLLPQRCSSGNACPPQPLLLGYARDRAHCSICQWISRCCLGRRNLVSPHSIDTLPLCPQAPDTHISPEWIHAAHCRLCSVLRLYGCACAETEAPGVLHPGLTCGCLQSPAAQGCAVCPETPETC